MNPSAGADPLAESAQRRTERIILVVLSAVQFTTIVDFMVVMPLGPQLMRTLHIDAAQFGLIVSSYTFAAGAAGLVASSIMDRFDRRTAFVVLYGGFLLGTLFCALAPNYHLLLAARVATGACGGILGGLSMAIIGDVFPEQRRGRATGSLMSAFALASVAGVPLGLALGTQYGWHIPFIALVVVGAPVLFIAPFAMPHLRAHLGRAHAHPLRQLVETFAIPNHQAAFALIATLMAGSFAVVPYISAYLVANVGINEKFELPWIYVAGGVLTLIGAPIIGRLADKHGKIPVYRVIAPASAVLLVVITHLPPTTILVASITVGLLMVTNAGRMIAAMAMITSSVQPQRRGGFMSANASVQHVASGLGAYLGGVIITQQSPTAPLEHFGIVGWFGAAMTLITLWLAGRVRIVDDGRQGHTAEAISLAAAAEATVDAGEPLIGA